MTEEHPPRGHRARAHTADVRIEAWAPSAEDCYAETVAAFVEIFAEVTGAPDGEQRTVRVGPGAPDRLVVLLLDEVLLLLDADGLVPRSARVECRDDSLIATLTVVPVAAIRIVGSVPKGVSYSGLEFGPDDGRWRCQAIIDV